jgi:hypothetical protein
MFVQIIQGKVADADGLRRQTERWQKELKPGAKGYLGSTSGVTADGESITIVRFESADAAAANSARPEQGQWWAETEKLFTGPVTFHDSSDIDVTLVGGSDDAGFVQVMQGRIHDLAALRKMEAEFMPQMAEQRPDVIGSIRARYGDGEFTEVIYFTSEAAAREGEAKMAGQTTGDSAEWEKTMQVDRWLDLTDPELHSP